MIVNYSIVGRNGKALVMNHNSSKYSVVNEMSRSTVMACMKALSELLSRFEQTDDVLNIVFIPRNLGGILRVNAVDEWIANGNKTKGGVQLSDEYIELAQYISDMRKWLGTNNVVLKIQGGELIRANEKIMIDKAWRQLDKVSAKKSNSVSRPSMNSKRPEVPSSVKAIAVNDLDI